MSDEFLILNAAPARAWLRDPKEPWRKPTLRKTLVDHRRAWAMYQAGVKTIRVRLHMLESPFFEELANKCDRLGIKIGDLMVRERQDRILHSGLKQCYMMDHFFNTPDGSIIAGLSFQKSQCRRIAGEAMDNPWHSFLPSGLGGCMCQRSHLWVICRHALILRENG